MPQPRKREEDLARDRSRRGGDVQPVSKGDMLPVRIPAMPKRWHESAKKLYSGMKSSGQRVYMQNSDWAVLYQICEEISNYRLDEDIRIKRLVRLDEWNEAEYEASKTLDAAGMGEWRRANPRPPAPGRGGSAMRLTAALNALGPLGLSEGDRRKMRIELQAPKEQETPASVTQLEMYRKGLEKQ